MPRMAASTPAMSLTWGKRMKLPIPVKRGAFIASRGRYPFLPLPLAGEGRGGGLGTSELALDRLHALFVDDTDHLVAQLGEPRATRHVEGPRPWQVDRQRRADTAGTVRHDVNHVAQEDRLVDVMGDEQHRLAIALPEVGQHLLHDLAWPGIERAEKLFHQQLPRILPPGPGGRGPPLYCTGQG